MTQPVADQLAAVRSLVEQAKSMPMSASCLVNRAELLAQLDRIAEAFREELAEARRGSGADAVAAAVVTAEQVLEDARARADALVAEDAVHAEAVARAAELTRAAEEEAEALRREADTYVDQRMAALEAVMAKTLAQVKTLRGRLSERSGLDEPPAD
nr:hypothetical protein [Propionibacterium sp.]